MMNTLNNILSIIIRKDDLRQCVENDPGRGGGGSAPRIRGGGSNVDLF